MADTKVAYQGWNSSNIYFGELPYGDAEQAITGLTSALGSVTISAGASVSVTGLAGTT